jgi:hypothetical protein
VADHGSAKHKRGNSFAPAVLLPTGSWEGQHGRGKFHICAHQNLQTSGVTNVVSSQAMTAIPLPMER